MVAEFLLNLVNERVLPFLDVACGFQARLGARPLRDTIEKHLRGAVADAILAELGTHSGQIVVCGEEVVLSPGRDPRGT